MSTFQIQSCVFFTLLLIVMNWRGINMLIMLYKKRSEDKLERITKEIIAKKKVPSLKEEGERVIWQLVLSIILVGLLYIYIFFPHPLKF